MYTPLLIVINAGKLFDDKNIKSSADNGTFFCKLFSCIKGN